MGADVTNDTYILFEVGTTTYGLSSQQVQHMEIIEQITPVPNAPAYVEGVVYSRGQVVPAINLRVRFGLPRQEHTLRSRLIVVQSGQRRVGLIVDSAREFRKLAPESILPPQDALSGATGNYLQGIVPDGERLIFLLSVNALLNISERSAGERAPARTAAESPLLHATS